MMINFTVIGKGAPKLPKPNGNDPLNVPTPESHPHWFGNTSASGGTGGIYGTDTTHGVGGVGPKAPSSPLPEIFAKHSAPKMTDAEFGKMNSTDYAAEAAKRGSNPRPNMRDGLKTPKVVDNTAGQGGTSPQNRSGGPKESKPTQSSNQQPNAGKSKPSASGGTPPNKPNGNSGQKKPNSGNGGGPLPQPNLKVSPNGPPPVPPLLQASPDGPPPLPSQQEPAGKKEKDPFHHLLSHASKIASLVALAGAAGHFHKHMMSGFHPIQSMFDLVGMGGGNGGFMHKKPNYSRAKSILDGAPDWIKKMNHFQAGV